MQDIPRQALQSLWDSKAKGTPKTWLSSWGLNNFQCKWAWWGKMNSVLTLEGHGIVLPGWGPLKSFFKSTDQSYWNENKLASCYAGFAASCDLGIIRNSNHKRLQEHHNCRRGRATGCQTFRGELEIYCLRGEAGEWWIGWLSLQWI